MTLFYIVGFILLALGLIGYFAVTHEPEGGWLGDPLPGLAEKGEREADTESNTVDTDHLDLEI